MILYEGSGFCMVCLEDFKEVYHGSDHKYTIRKGGGGGKKQSQKDKTKSIKSIGS